MIYVSKDGRFAGERKDGTETLWMPGREARRMISGVASTPTVDTENESLSSLGCSFKLPLPLLFRHGKDPDGRVPRYAHLSYESYAIGEVVFASKNAREVRIKATIHDTPAADHAWRLIESGEVTCLSVQPSDLRLQGVVEGVRYISSWKCLEISVCRTGANPDCKLRILRNDSLPPARSMPVSLR